MQLSIPETELRELLTAIERGIVQLTPTKTPDSVYSGVVEYVADNGWRLAVFNDCNEWDYLEWIESPDGRRVDYDQLWDCSDLAQYEPTPEVAWKRYHFPR